MSNELSKLYQEKHTLRIIINCIISTSVIQFFNILYQLKIKINKVEIHYNFEPKSKVTEKLNFKLKK